MHNGLIIKKINKKVLCDICDCYILIKNKQKHQKKYFSKTMTKVIDKHICSQNIITATQI